MLLSEAQLDPGVDVVETHAVPVSHGVLLLLQARAFEESFHLFLRHAKAVVYDIQIYVVSVPGTADQDLSVPVHALHAIVNSIFQDRLQDQFDGAQLLDLLRDLIAH